MSSITMEELKAAAKRLPVSGVPYGRYFKVLIDRPVEALCYSKADHIPDPREMRVDCIEFEARPTKVHGHRAVAWYWHELLVRVTV